MANNNPIPKKALMVELAERGRNYAGRDRSYEGQSLKLSDPNLKIVSEVQKEQKRPIDYYKIYCLKRELNLKTITPARKETKITSTEFTNVNSNISYNVKSRDNDNAKQRSKEYFKTDYKYSNIVRKSRLGAVSEKEARLKDSNLNLESTNERHSVPSRGLSTEEIKEKYKITDRRKSNNLSIMNETEKKYFVHKTKERVRKTIFKTGESIAEKIGVSNSSSSSSEKNKKSKKGDSKSKKKNTAKEAAIKQVKRDFIIKTLTKPESDIENNMTTGFGKFITDITNIVIRDLFKHIIKLLASLIWSAISNLISFIISILPEIVIPIVVVCGFIGIICTILSFFFSGYTESKEDSNYIVNVLSGYYDTFDANISEWLSKTTQVTVENDEDSDEEVETIQYTVVYENGCDAINNFYDVILIYYSLLADTDFNDTVNSDNVMEMPMLIIDTLKESTTLNVLYNEMNYTRENGTELDVYKLTADDWINQHGLNDKQKQMYNVMRDLINKGIFKIDGEVNTSSSVDLSKLVSGELGTQTVKFAISKLGYPYSQALRNDGNHFDCSSLAYYAWLSAGVDISYNGSTTAAEIARGFDAKNCTVSYDKMQPGDLIFYSFSQNGRYKNIDHVAIYCGDGYVCDASYSRGEVVYRPIYGTSNIVLIGRPSKN